MPKLMENSREPIGKAGELRPLWDLDVITARVVRPRTFGRWAGIERLFARHPDVGLGRRKEFFGGLEIWQDDALTFRLVHDLELFHAVHLVGTEHYEGTKQREGLFLFFARCLVCHQLGEGFVENNVTAPCARRNIVGPSLHRAAHCLPLVERAVPAGLDAVLHRVDCQQERVDPGVRLSAGDVAGSA